jgi:myo-inositol-1-phosphate synthase
MGSVRVAIVGVGNCASSLVQGVEYYKDADPASRVPGLMHVQFGPYHVSDVEFVAAFDVDAKKVGRDIAEAIVASENNTIKICDVPPTGVTVQRGPTMDGLGEYYQEIITESDEQPVDAARDRPTSSYRTCRRSSGGPLLRAVRDRRRRRVRQRAARLHRLRSAVGAQVRRGRSAHHRR